jgi:hypothetical protein
MQFAVITKCNDVLAVDRWEIEPVIKCKLPFPKVIACVGNPIFAHHAVQFYRVPAFPAGNSCGILCDAA